MTTAAHQSKAQILQLLRGKEPVVSGQHLSKRVGLSRVAVWKHIRKLCELGYEIEATAKGYRLLRSPDTPYPWEFPGREGLIHHFAEADSTMEIARQMARNDCPAMTTVVADRQRQGRGRLQRRWESDTGGLYFTVVTRPGVDPQQSGRVNLAASVALAGVVSGTFGIDARVKWPNDILVGERKLAGLLAQMDAEADRTAFVNIGIGINVNNDPTGSAPKAVSMRRLLGREVAKTEVLAVFLDRLTQMLDAGLGPELIEQWRAVNATLGRAVKVETAWQSVEGTAVDVDENGALIVETTGGERETIFYGDCFHLGKDAGAFPE